MIVILLTISTLIVLKKNPNFKENDSLINLGHKELAKTPVASQKKSETKKSENKPKSEKS